MKTILQIIDMKPALIIRFSFIAILWLLLVYLVAKSDTLPFMKVFVIIASFIIVFVPLYKKHIKKGNS